MGFTNVNDYVAGKQDWLANGFPTEGKRADEARIGDLAERDVPSCFLKESVGTVKERVAEARWDMAVAVDEDGVILGLLRDEQLASPPDRTVEEMMKPGPATWRPNVSVEKMVRHAQRYQLHHLIVSTPDGVLVGVLTRTDIERLAAAVERLTKEEASPRRPR